MAKENLENIIEALLFTTDKPLPSSALAGAADAQSKEVEEAVDRINIRLKESGSPIMIKQVAGGYEYLTLPGYAPYIKKLYRHRFLARLSKPAMEVLAIIAYKQPVTKQEVELIRGVNSDGVYHTLLERKLVKIAGRKESPGRPLLFGTTREFLQYLGVNAVEDLPKIEEIKSILEKEENVENWDDRIEKAKSQTLFDFDNEGKSVSTRFKEEKEGGNMEDTGNTGTAETAEQDDAGKKRWQEEYEEQYGEKEEDAYKRDDDEEELEDEDEEPGELDDAEEAKKKKKDKKGKTGADVEEEEDGKDDDGDEEEEEDDEDEDEDEEAYEDDHDFEDEEEEDEDEEEDEEK
jgi:segregation and condensation protein B